MAYQKIVFIIGVETRFVRFTRVCNSKHSYIEVNFSIRNYGNSSDLFYSPKRIL